MHREPGDKRSMRRQPSKRDSMHRQTGKRESIYTGKLVKRGSIHRQPGKKREASISNLVRGKGYTGKMVNGEACTGQLERKNACVGKTKCFISVSKRSRVTELMLVLAIQYAKGLERVITLPGPYEENLTANTSYRLQVCTEFRHKMSCVKVRYSVIKAIKLKLL